VGSLGGPPPVCGVVIVGVVVFTSSLGFGTAGSGFLKRGGGGITPFGFGALISTPFSSFTAFFGSSYIIDPFNIFKLPL